MLHKNLSRNIIHFKFKNILYTIKHANFITNKRKVVHVYQKCMEIICYRKHINIFL